MCVRNLSLCITLSHTTQHRTVRVILADSLQTIIIAHSDDVYCTVWETALCIIPSDYTQAVGGVSVDYFEALTYNYRHYAQCFF